MNNDSDAFEYRSDQSYSSRVCGCNLCAGPEKPAVPKLFLSGTEAQLREKAEGLLFNNSNIVFDFISNQPDSGIFYCKDTGEFILPANKNYYVSWWAAVDGTEFSHNVEFAVAVDRKLVSVASSPNVTCQFSGDSLVSIGNESKTLTLVNVSGNTVRFANTTVQASIVIIELVAEGMYKRKQGILHKNYSS